MVNWLIEDGGGFEWVPACAVGTSHGQPLPPWDGAEQSPEPRPCPSLAGGQLGRFRLVMVSASYTRAGAG